MVKSWNFFPRAFLLLKNETWIIKREREKKMCNKIKSQLHCKENNYIIYCLILKDDHIVTRRYKSSWQFPFARWRPRSASARYRLNPTKSTDQYSQYTERNFSLGWERGRRRRWSFAFIISIVTFLSVGDKLKKITWHNVGT